MARQELFIDVFETDTFNEWRLKTNSIKLNLQDVYDELDALDDRVVLLTGNQTIDGVKSFVKKSIWTKEYTQNEVTPLLELRVTNSTFPHAQNIGHKGTGPAIDFYNPDTTTGGNTWLTSRIASITESNNDILPDASLVFYTGKNVQDIVEKMRITSSGNVGIGTSSPLEQLSIQTSTNNSVVSIQSKDDKYAAISFGDSKSNKSGQIQYHNIDNSMRIFTGEYASNGSAERVRITSNGRVGVGTSSPSEKLDVVGNLKTTGWIEAGSETGGIALTLNDGYGNSNIAFNHSYGKATVDGSSGRIRCDVDEDIALMRFELGDDRGKNSIGSLSPVVDLTTSKISLLKDTDITGKLYTSGKIGIRETDPDWDLCIGNKTTEAGHAALHADGGAISLRPLKNTTHRWLLDAIDNNAGNFQIISGKWNTVKNDYDNIPTLTASVSGDISIKRNLSIGGYANIGQMLLGDTWNFGNPPGGQKLYIKKISSFSEYDPYGSGSEVDDNSNYTLSKSKFPLIISDNNSNTSGPNSHGIVLYNASGTPGSFAPSILFASRESGNTNYRTAISGIYSRMPTGEGGSGGEWNDGELIFATSGFLTGTTTNSNGLTQRMVIDRAGKVGIGITNPTQTLDVKGNIRGTGLLYLTDDGYPQLVLSNADYQTKRFGVWREGSLDALSIGPHATNGAGTPALRVYRNATVDILKGGKVNTVLNDDKALVNKGWVEAAIDAGGLVNIGGSDVFQATGNITHSKGVYNYIQSPLGNSIPEEGAGNHSHGERFAGILTSTNTGNGGGLFLEVTDDNNDEHALSIYNTTQSIDKEVFHIRSATGDAYSAGDIYARGGIGSETKLVIGDKDEYWSVEKNNTDLRIVYRRGGTSKTALTLNPLGQQLIENEPTGPKHAATKQYVDNKFSSVNNVNTTTFPRYAVATGTAAVKSDYAANTAFSFDIKTLTGLSSDDVARVYAVDATIHNFGSAPHDYHVLYRYPDSEYREVQGSKGYNNDDDCGGSAQVLLPVSGSYVTFMSNMTGTNRGRSQRKVVINGFWYYDAAATPLTAATLPAVDKFDIDVLILPTVPGALAYIDPNINSFLSENVTHAILRRVYQPRPAAGDQAAWDEFDAVLDSNEYGIFATNTFANFIDGKQFNADDIPQTTYNKIRDFITRGGSLFIFSDHTRVFRNQVGLEGIIPELGGIKSSVDGTALDENNVRYNFINTIFRNSFTLTNTVIASELGIIAPRGVGGTLKTAGAGRVINAASRGIPLAEEEPGYSPIHGWFGKLGHLNTGVKGNIIWFGDINLQGDLGTRIMNPLLTYIQRTQ